MGPSGPFFMDTIYGYKSEQTQKYTSSGKRVPVTIIKVNPMIVSQVKKDDKDGYKAVQIMTTLKGGDYKTRQEFKSIKGIKHIREIRLEEEAGVNMGDSVSLASIVKPGDLVNVTGVSKGKGFAGVVKRHGFAGGPKTHGQSDRHRAPGAIAQGTTPGRVNKGKRMAGHMGAVQRTQRNLTVMDVKEDQIMIKGTIPGPLNSLNKISKIGVDKKFNPLMGTGGLDKEAIAEEQALMEAQAEVKEEAQEGEKKEEAKTE